MFKSFGVFSPSKLEQELKSCGDREKRFERGFGNKS